VNPPPDDTVLDLQKIVQGIGIAGAAWLVLKVIGRWAKHRIIRPPLEEALRETLKPELTKIDAAAGEVRQAADALVRLTIELRTVQRDIRLLQEKEDELRDRVIALTAVAGLDRRMGPEDRRHYPQLPQIPERRHQKGRATDPDPDTET
jgi:hypothetical protein